MSSAAKRQEYDAGRRSNVPLAAKPSSCPVCGAPVSSSVEDYYCAELCGWAQPREQR